MLDPTLDLALASIGTSLAELRASTPEIVVFGSRAADVARANSDWDILCVGRGTSRATPKIDLLWVTADSLRTEQWTGSELAGHISTWGRWIWGTRSWRAGPAPSSFSLTLKERRIVSRARAMRLTWEGLSSLHRNKHLGLLRRDLVRYSLLKSGSPIPPTTQIDAMLHNGAISQAELETVARNLELKHLFARFSRTADEKTA